MPGSSRYDKLSSDSWDVLTLVENLLVLRASPDWLDFDLEKTRPFLASFGLPESLIIDFDQLWRRHFRGDYRSIRAQLKTLALQTYANVGRASLVSHEDWQEEPGIGGWVAFVDDDDWMSPALFESLPEPGAADDGVRWGSLRLGRLFAENGYDKPIIQARPFDRIVYTNNYAVTARALNRFGRRSLFEHDAAQVTFDRPDFTKGTADRYLSCAVKHPCCTMSVSYLMQHDEFRRDPRREMVRFMEALEEFSIDQLEGWMRPLFQEFREIMAGAVPAV